jgi:L-glyceraldehyde 3-phosphate reductase
MALAWVLRHETMTSVLIGASRPAQVIDAVAATRSPPFEPEILNRIDQLVGPLQPQ